MKTKQNFEMKKNLSQTFLRLLMVLSVLPMAILNAWGGGITGASSYVKTEAVAPAEGLVYCNKSNAVTPSDSDYKRYYPGGSGTGADNTGCYVNLGAAKSGVYIYCWAKPARGYEFDHWDGYEKGYLPYGDQNKSKPLDTGSWNGVNDQMVGTCGNGQSTYKQHQAYFKPVASFTITYTPPVGGSYNVNYSYLKTREKEGGEYEFYTATEDYDLTPSLEEATVVTSYAADKITLTTPTTATNFIGWYEGETLLGMGTGSNHSYTYTAHATGVTVCAQFKEIGWGDVSGDLTVNATAKDTYNGKKVYIACPTLIGTWTDADFTITTTALSNTFGSIALGSATLDKTNNRLEIPYSYTATDWGGISVDVTVTPAYGETKQFTIAASAEEVVAYEACIEESGVRTYTGSLDDMMAQANNMNNKPTLKLMQDMAITTPLSFTQSFTFDVNGKVLTANCASAFSIDAAGIDVQIIDGSFTQVGEIHTSYSSSGNVNVVTFTKAAKLTMQGGTLSVENTGTGSAYGVDVQQGSIFYMTGGDLTVTATTGNAQGVHVATSNDYATFNGGSIVVSAPTNAYGMWSAGQSNITNATITVEATTGANAYGVYVNGGTSTMTTTDFTINAATANAYGANVNAGRLNFNGGKLEISAVTSDVYGVHIASGAIANIQQKTDVKVEATGVSGTKVLGVNNLGTVSLNNITVTATSPTDNAKAINTASSAISTTIEDGTYTANAETGLAYGLHHQYGALSVDGGTFKGIVKTSGTKAYGVCAVANAEIANATLLGETRGSGNTAYGFDCDVADKDITLTNCAISGLSAKSKAYAIYTKANVAAINCTLTATTSGSDNVNDGAEAYGMYAENGTNVLTNCSATITSNTIKSYGINHVAGSLTVTGGIYVVKAKQATASTDENTNLYGLYNATGVTSTVNGAEFRVTAENASRAQYVYGAYINGTLNSTSATYNVTARRYVYGIQGMGSSNLALANNSIRVEATNTATTNSNSSWSYGIYAKKDFSINGDKVDAIGQIKDVYAMFFDSSTSKGDVLDGKFSAQGNGTNGYGALNAAATVGKVYLKGGVYKSAINLAKYAYTDYKVYNMDGSHPDYADGYRYTIATENPSPYVCRIVGGAYYATLKEALQYTLDNSGNYTIVMTQNHTLPAGEYTLPANATLVIPYKFDQNAITVQGSNPADPDTRITAGLVENFLCLTIADGVHLNVNGKIGVGGELFCQESNKSSYINGPYGRIHMEEGSLIQLNSGSFLYAWGMITGDGNIIVKNNAEVHEMFQVGDMKSASNLANYYNNNSEKFFPITQYGILNIEVPTTYYYNSRLIGALLCYYPGLGGVYYGEKNVKLVGTENALFEITTENEATWVRKSYKNARQVWDINSSAKLGSISISISISGLSSSFNSANYILPITNNMDMHVLSGDFEITHNAELLPGSTIEIDKTASLTINEGQKLYVFDKDQWPFSTGTVDAAINVHGNINVNGALYTTQSIANGTNATHGANIYSNNADAGTIAFENAAPSSTTTIDLITGIANSAKVKKTVTMDPAKLKNGTGASQPFTPTSGTDAGHAFAYINNEWQVTYTDGCFEIKGEHVYAKPGDYVELKKQREVVGDYDDLYICDNHTYLSIDETRMFIHLPDDEGDCQWWEVEATTDPTVFECTKTGYEGFYYYDNSNPNPQLWTWALKSVEVKFYAAETGEEVLKTITTDFNGVPNQAVIATNPAKATTDAATYQFYGWKSSVTGTEYPWTATLEVATADMSYRPVFTATPRNYTVTFKNANNGADVPVETAYNTHPVCTPAPTKNATAQYTYYFQYWLDSDGVTQYAPDAELPVVTGATYYTAVWTQTVNKYSIIWKNGDDVLETDTKQEYGSATAYNGALPTKETDNNYVYAFSGWRSSMTGQTYANGSTPEVAGETTYEAQFTTTPRYKVTFTNYDGSELYHEYVTQNEHPIYNGLTPGRARDYDGYFKFIGWKNSDGTDFGPNATLPAVTGKETYTAQYDYVTELYLITLNNVDGAGASWSGKFGVGSTPFYDPNNDDVADMPTKAGNAQYSYPFEGWDPELEPVSGEASYTALFGQQINSYTITFANLDGNGKEREVIVEYGQTPVSPETPEKADNYFTYDFLGWAEGSIAAVTGDATYTAQFSSTGTPRTFPITFDPDNGVDAPYVVNVAYGQTPTTSDPTKAADASNTYTFSGWTPAIHAVDGPAEYTAQYTPTIRTYTITFKNYDGTVLQSTSMPYGATPSYSGVTPVKPVDVANRKVYTFDGWSSTNGGSKLNELPAVNGEATYYAHYTEATYVASVIHGGGESYKTSWSNAYTDAQANDIIKLYDNLTFTSAVSIAKNLTIDLNGHTMYRTGSSTSAIYLIQMSTANVTLTIEDSNPLGGGLIHCVNTSRSSYAINVTQSATVTINGGTIKGEKQNTSTNTSRIGVGVYLANANARLNINGGEVIGTSSGGNNYAVSHSSTSNGYTTVTGGKLKAATSIFQNPSTSRVTLHGGYYNKDVSSNCVAPYYDFATTEEERAVVGNDYTHKVAAAYTITFNNWDGSNLATLQKQIVGTTPAYTGSTPTKEPQSLYTFRAWKAEGDEHEYDMDALPPVAGNTTYVAQFDVAEEFVIDGNTSINNDVEVINTVVVTTGVLNTNGHTLTTTNLILEADPATSGQIADGSYVNVTGNVYYDLKLNTAARHWHAFGVPWAVDLNVNPLTEVETGRTLTLGSHYEIVYYDTYTRAAQGAGAHCWKYLKHYDQAGQPIDELAAGKGYMIAFTSPVQTVRFVKKSGAPIFFDGSNSVTGGAGEDGGWNAIANPMAYHATLNAGPTVGYVHDGGEIGSDGYTPYDINGTRYIVGKTVYVQASSDASIVVEPAGEAGEMTVVSAPKRRQKATDKQYLSLSDYYAVSLTNADGVESKVYVLPEEDKADKYVIGHDLSQFSMSDKKAQIWVDRYDTKLALNTTAPVADMAYFPISLYAPAEGEYTISSLPSEVSDQYMVYLTLNGKAIWNLSSSPYTLTLNGGIDSNYGLRLYAEQSPQTTTGIDEAVIDAQGQTQKVLIHDKVYIIRGDEVYTLDGRLVK